MKPILKFTTALLFFQLLVTTIFAQNKEKAFVGTWMLDQVSSNGSSFSKTPAGLFYKIYNADKTFLNLRTQNKTSVTTHSGTYKVLDGYYLERALQRLPSMVSNVALGTDFKINYEFSEDQKQLTLSFIAISGAAYIEIWKRQEQNI